MLLCSLYLQLVLLLPNIYSRAELYTYNEKKPSNDPQKESETIFTDVLRNISRVNNALQELIHNYEQIQKFYETNSFEKDLSSSAEIDHFYKNKKNNKKRKTRTNVKNINMPKKEFPATVMIVSDSESNSKTDESEEDTFKEAKELKETIDNQILEDTKKNIAENLTDDSHIKEPYTDIDSYLKEPLENLPLMNEGKKSHKGPQIIILHPQREQNKVDIEKENVTSQVKKLKRKRIKRPKPIPTRDNTEPATPLPRIRQKPLRNVEKVLFAESFPQNKIWDQIAEKKPIKLRALRMPNIKLQKIHFRSRKAPQTALVIVTKNNKRKQDHVDIPTSLEHVFSSDSEDLNSKIIRSNILRHDYGQACMRMVVKKCYKACKEVKKLACKVTSCKSSFKEKFQDKSKTGCIKEFRPVRQGSDEKNETTFLKKYAKKSDFEDDDDEDEDFADITRNGFPAEKCFPFMIPQASSKRNPSSSNASLSQVESHKQALRDRYERACERASADKCNNACLYAYKETCETYDCNKGKKKQFRRHCKKQCKKAYKSKREKRSSETSSTTESDSDDDDDSDTDFDTEDFERR